MKIAICLYHKNPFDIYKPEWICKCLKTLSEQTYDPKNTYIFVELNYSNIQEDYPISLLELGYFRDIDDKSKIKMNKVFNDNYKAMNFCFDYAFEKLNTDVCFNVNIDDYYNDYRISKSLEYINEGYELLTSNVCFISGNRKRFTNLNRDNISDELLMRLKIQQKKNIIVMSSLCITKSGWEKNGHISSTKYLNGYIMMKNIMSKNIKTKICNEHFVFKRV
jgi:hypothetical protein